MGLTGGARLLAILRSVVPVSFWPRLTLLADGRTLALQYPPSIQGIDCAIVDLNAFIRYASVHRPSLKAQRAAAGEEDGAAEDDDGGDESGGGGGCATWLDVLERTVRIATAPLREDGGARTLYIVLDAIGGTPKVKACTRKPRAGTTPPPRPVDGNWTAALWGNLEAPARYTFDDIAAAGEGAKRAFYEWVTDAIVAYLVDSMDEDREVFVLGSYWQGRDAAQIWVRRGQATALDGGGGPPRVEADLAMAWVLRLRRARGHSSLLVSNDGDMLLIALSIVASEPTPTPSSSSIYIRRASRADVTTVAGYAAVAPTAPKPPLRELIDVGALYEGLVVALDGDSIETFLALCFLGGNDYAKNFNQISLTLILKAYFGRSLRRCIGTLLDTSGATIRVHFDTFERLAAYCYLEKYDIPYKGSATLGGPTLNEVKQRFGERKYKLVPPSRDELRPYAARLAFTLNYYLGCEQSPSGLERSPSDTLSIHGYENMVSGEFVFATRVTEKDFY